MKRASGGKELVEKALLPDMNNPGHYQPISSPTTDKVFYLLVLSTNFVIADKDKAMRVTIEIDSQNELEKLSALFKAFKINTVNVLSADDAIIPVIKGDKKIDPNALFNIWADKPRSLADIREADWKRS